jgi:hypothetical protein
MIDQSPTSLLALPEDMSLDQLAEWFTEHFEEIKRIRSFLYQTSSRLTEWVRESGPQRTAHGLLEISPKGYLWDAEIIREVMPALLTGGKATFEGNQDQIERILSLVLEEVPEVAYEVKWTVDKYAAAAVIKAGGEAGEKVLAARKPDGALGVR